jgi:hypothetical protein
MDETEDDPDGGFMCFEMFNEKLKWDQRNGAGTEK